MAGSLFYVRFVVAISAAAMLAGGCAGGASGGAQVTVVCGATEEWCAAHTEAFTEQTGIEAGFVRMSSGEAVARLKAGKANPEFDVWHGGPADGYVVAAGEGLLEPYLSPGAQVIRPEWKAQNGSWTGVYIGVLAFCSNKKILSAKGLSAPTSWEDLLDPRYAENILMADPSTSGTGYTALWTQVALAGGDEDKALEYFRSLRPNILRFPESGLAPMQQVALGEVATGIVFSHDCVAAQEQGYSDLELTFPREGAGYEAGGLAVIKGAHHPDGARAYIDWALTPRAQEIGPTVRSYQVPTNPAATVSDKSARLDQLRLVTYDFGAAGAAKPALVKRFDAEVI